MFSVTMDFLVAAPGEGYPGCLTIFIYLRAMFYYISVKQTKTLILLLIFLLTYPIWHQQTR